MTQHTQKSRLTDFDLMIIRADGRTEAELEAMVQSGFGFAIMSSTCAFVADGLYRLVLLLESGARRSAEASHLRLTASSTI
ncbi:hypothetical protein [Ruegeria sp. HKCCA6837]|uniref:hypothetical protein n=1 Tax=Ruegeria sp. HKCCA6837 TaxID=2682989 RepID=UPI0014891F4F|nr:hypothetical protein [Ruegeria sp. HKCCA6837]